MDTSSSRVVAAVVACACLVVALPTATSAQGSVDRAMAARVFAERMDRYVWLRARFEEPLPSFDPRRDPWSLFLSRRYLASAIRTARAHARPGEMFAPPVDALFRDVIAEAIYEVDIEGLVEGESSVVDVMVNEPVPDWAQRRVPPKLLERLPPLPEAIEYRIVSGALVLWDAHAEIVIDGLPNAFVVE